MQNELNKQEISTVCGACISGQQSMSKNQWYDVPSLPGGTSYVLCNSCRSDCDNLYVYCNGVYSATLGKISMASCKIGSVMTVQTTDNAINMAWISVSN